MQQNLIRPCIAALILTSALSSCSSTQHLKTDALQFRTLITADNFKRFEISVQPKPLNPMSQMGGRANPRDNGDSDRSESIQRRTDTYLKYALEDTLEKNGFCRAGYLLLGRFAGENQYRLRGECKDAASPDDRVKFPNTIEKW